MKGFLFLFFSWLDSLADMVNIKKIQFVFQVKKKKITRPQMSMVTKGS